MVRWALAMCSGMVRTPGIRTCGVIGAGERYQLSVVSDQLSGISYQLSVVGLMRGGRRLGWDQPALRTGIEATAGASRHGYAAGNIAFATKGIGTCIVMPPAPPAALTRAAEFDNCVGRGPAAPAFLLSRHRCEGVAPSSGNHASD